MIQYKLDRSREIQGKIDDQRIYTKTYEIDASEIFGPLAKMNRIHVLSFITTNFNWQLQRFNVKKSFMHRELEKEIYMEIPLKFIRGIKANQICELKKSLYKLKQSPGYGLEDLKELC